MSKTDLRLPSLRDALAAAQIQTISHEYAKLVFAESYRSRNPQYKGSRVIVKRHVDDVALDIETGTPVNMNAEFAALLFIALLAMGLLCIKYLHGDHSWHVTALGSMTCVGLATFAATQLFNRMRTWFGLPLFIHRDYRTIERSMLTSGLFDEGDVEALRRIAFALHEEVRFEIVYVQEIGLVGPVYISVHSASGEAYVVHEAQLHAQEDECARVVTA